MSDFSFIQLADPQLGLFAEASGKTNAEIAAFAERGMMLRKVKKFSGFAPETALFTRAIERANWLKPAFVVVCGDMVNDPDDQDQVTEVKRIGALLDDSIALHWVPGNHDVTVDHYTPEQKYIDQYRKNFGPEYYAFSHEGIRFIVINSSVLTSPKTMDDQAKEQLDFVEAEAIIAGHQSANRIVLFSHHPLFVESANEADNPWSIKKKYRKPLVEIAADHGIKATFAGPWPRNNYANDSGIEVVTSGPVGYPLGNDSSGFRVVNVTNTSIEHKYYSLEENN
jgi:3',5'-cyclic AMP phosphodiesterase CpdA